MWDSLHDMIVERSGTDRLPVDMLKGSLVQLLYGLDFLHTTCKLVHTDIKAANLMSEIRDESLLDQYADDEMAIPSPRKQVHGQIVYQSRMFRHPKEFGVLVLSDFGSAVSGEERRNHDAQPSFYRSPETLLKIDWSYPADIWNVGAMIWTLFEGKHLFRGRDVHLGKYMTRAHLADVIAALGHPPLDLIQRGERSPEFFDVQDGRWISEHPLREPTSLEQIEENLERREQERFLRFLRKMLAWRPEERATAKELLDDEWLREGWETL